MASKPTNWMIVALYTDGVAHYQVGRKMDPAGKLDEENVEWKTDGSKPLRFSEYQDAVVATKR